MQRNQVQSQDSEGSAKAQNNSEEGSFTDRSEDFADLGDLDSEKKVFFQESEKKVEDLEVQEQGKVDLVNKDLQDIQQVEVKSNIQQLLQIRKSDQIKNKGKVIDLSQVEGNQVVVQERVDAQQNQRGGVQFVSGQRGKDLRLIIPTISKQVETGLRNFFNFLFFEEQSQAFRVSVRGVKNKLVKFYGQPLGSVNQKQDEFNEIVGDLYDEFRSCFFRSSTYKGLDLEKQSYIRNQLQKQNEDLFVSVINVIYFIYFLFGEKGQFEEEDIEVFCQVIEQLPRVQFKDLDFYSNEKVEIIETDPRKAQKEKDLENVYHVMGQVINKIGKKIQARVKLENPQIEFTFEDSLAKKKNFEFQVFVLFRYQEQLFCFQSIENYIQNEAQIEKAPETRFDSENQMEIEKDFSEKKKNFLTDKQEIELYRDQGEFNFNALDYNYFMNLADEKEILEALSNPNIFPNYQNFPPLEKQNKNYEPSKVVVIDSNGNHIIDEINNETDTSAKNSDSEEEQYKRNIQLEIFDEEYVRFLLFKHLFTPQEQTQRDKLLRDQVSRNNNSRAIEHRINECIKKYEKIVSQNKNSSYN